MIDPRPIPMGIVCALVLLDGCATGTRSDAEPPGTGPASVPATVRMRCGDQEIAVGFREQAMRLQMGDESFDLREVISASGAKYEAVGDPTTTYWSKGKNATLVVRGRSYPECVPAGGAPPAFRARGNEPPWTLDIAADRMTLLTDYGQKRLEVPTPAVERSPGLSRYSASSGSTRVESLAAAAVLEGSSVTLAFGEDRRVSGQASCNGFTGEYSLTGEGLSVGQVATTRKACPPPLMQQEEAFLGLLGGVQRFEITPDGRLVLLAADGRKITAKR